MTKAKDKWLMAGSVVGGWVILAAMLYVFHGGFGWIGLILVALVVVGVFVYSAFS